MEQTLKELIEECKSFQAERFKEKDKSIENAFHVPYSGMGNPDYIRFEDYIKEDVHQAILQLVDNKGDDIESIEDLIEAWDEVDYDGMLHEYIDSSLTWQQSLRESEIIIRNCKSEECDTGLWEGLQPEEAIRAKAFWTYKLEVQEDGRELIKEYEE